ncbi:trypsin-7, partial [Asbolus verrucosus]
RHGNPLTERIVGGKPISIEEVPFQVSIEWNNVHKCGGSIISKNKVVTAAHCTRGKMGNILSIRAGTTVREHGGQSMSVRKIHQHPKYTKETADYDISILELEQNLKFGKSVAPINLPHRNQTFEAGTEALTLGWGSFISGSSRLSTELQSVFLKIVDKKECHKLLPSKTITGRMLCAGVKQGGKDACQGDSGGPLVVNGVLGGITSWGVGCGHAGLPGIYSNMAALREFIDNVAGI